MADKSAEIASRVASAYRAKTPLNIHAGGTKSFLGPEYPGGDPLDVTGHRGIIDYDPAELVLVARCGTRLESIEDELLKNRQMLGFEPPFVQDGATLGGAVAAGLAGPRRAFAGAARDFMLGAKFVNGKGEIITTGGKVIKNVAGFDLFRPMARSMGTLGVLLTVSLRLLPLPEQEKTLLHEEKEEQTALEKINHWSSRTQSISGATWDGHIIRIRLSGSAASMEHGRTLIGGEWLEDEQYWRALNNLQLDFFQQPGRLWRISVPPMSGPVHDGQPQLLDWGGAQRWLKTDQPPDIIRARATALGGHAECYSRDSTVDTFHPLSREQLVFNQKFKAALDPAGILNPGRLYREL